MAHRFHKLLPGLALSAAGRLSGVGLNHHAGSNGKPDNGRLTGRPIVKAVKEVSNQAITANRLVFKLSLARVDRLCMIFNQALSNEKGTIPTLMMVSGWREGMPLRWGKISG